MFYLRDVSVLFVAYEKSFIRFDNLTKAAYVFPDIIFSTDRVTVTRADGVFTDIKMVVTDKGVTSSRGISVNVQVCSGCGFESKDED